MQDIAAIAKAAHAKGAIVLMDNTWATPLYFRPLDHGVDLAIQAGTKYIGGHSDVMLGTVSANAAHCGEPQNNRAPQRPVRRAGRRLSRAARLAHARGAARSALQIRSCRRALAGSSGRKFCACCIRRCRAIPATRSGSGISPAHPACSAWCSSRCRRKRSTLFSTRSNCSASARRGAATRASPFRSTARRRAPPHAGSRADRRCASISGLRRSRI